MVCLATLTQFTETNRCSDSFTAAHTVLSNINVPQNTNKSDKHYVTLRH